MAERDQSFSSYQEWVNKASSWLTRHPKYNDSRRSGYGPHFTAICFDTKGRQCTCGGDMMRARDEEAFPVRWLWPDQVARIGSEFQGGIPETDDCHAIPLTGGVA